MSPAVLLMGPTASGKSMLALALASRLDVEIVSVDSAQIYRGMDIGTAKPDAATRTRVAHHLIDIVDPTDAYSAARFRDDAIRAIAGIRARLDARAALEGWPALHAELARVDAATAARLDSTDAQRIQRALEVYELAG